MEAVGAASEGEAGSMILHALSLILDSLSHLLQSQTGQFLLQFGLSWWFGGQ